MAATAAILDDASKQALRYAAQQLKVCASNPQSLREHNGQSPLPRDVCVLLRSPQLRVNTTVHQALFTVVAHIPTEVQWVNAIIKEVTQHNPKPTPTNPRPAGFVSEETLRAQWAHARRVTAQHKAREEKKNTLAQKEEALIIDDAAGEEEKDLQIYERYRASKVDGDPHPDPIVETASLASIQPPAPTYAHHLQDCVAKKQLSDAQLETVIYANMRFQTQLQGVAEETAGAGATAGFFLGDGAGVGKGRQIAALIKEHERTGGRRTLWISVSNDLRYDARRDLDDVDAKATEVYPQGNAPLPKGKLDAYIPEGVLFITYSLLVSGAKTAMGKDDANVDQDVQFDIRVTKGTRLAQVIDWLKGDKAPLIVLDESHKAKNLVTSKGNPTQTGKAILKLQMNVPKAKVLYSSATGASEPNNLAYMCRLGCCGFKSMSELVKELNESGLGSLEMFSMGLKATGSYVSRTLSYSGAEFSLAKVDIDPIFKVMYDRSCAFWHLLGSVLKQVSKPKKTMAMYWGAQQRFYRQMLMAAKVPECARLALEAVDNDMCVVIGLQSTGEANTTAVREQMGDVMEDFVSAPRQIMQHFLENHFPLGAGDNLDTQLTNLQAQVWHAVNEWKNVLPAKEQAAVEAAKAVRRGRGGANGATGADTSAAPAGPSAPSTSKVAGRSAAFVDSDAEEEIDFVEDMDQDQMLERQREEAVRAGRFIDLDDYDQDVVKKAEAGMAAEEAAAQREEQAKAAARTAEAEGLRRTELEEAEVAVKQAQADYKKAVQALARADSSPVPSGNTSGRKRLQRHASSTSEIEADADADTAESPPKKRAAPRKTQAVRQKKRAPSPKQPAVAPDVIDLATTDEDSDDEPAPRGGQMRLDSDSDEDFEPEAEAKSRSKSQGRAARARSRNLSVMAIVDSEDECMDDECMDEEEDAACKACGLTDRHKEMLVCDGCDAAGAHHLECLDPPLEEVPPGEWFCPACVTKAEGAKEARGAASAGKPRKLMEEMAAKRRLDAAEKALDTLKRRLERETRAAGRRGNARRDAAPAGTSCAAARRAVRADLDSGSDSFDESSLAQASDDDSDFEDEESAPPALVSRPRDVKPDIKPDIKPKVPEYRHATQHETLDDDWEDEVEVMAVNEGSRADEHPAMRRIRNMLLRLWASFELPANPLDQLTQLMGGPDKVAEMTGREGQLVKREDGMVAWNKRRAADSGKKMVNMKEKQDFMTGEKLIAIISEAASTGISLQADKRVGNQRRRCHLTLELPWSADKAIQQFGRSHRSNQTSAPLYRIIVTQVAGEFRFAASAAKRLQSLGALLKGDRRALGAGSDLKEFDVDNKWGYKALQRIFEDICLGTNPMPGVVLPEVPEDRREPGVDYSWPRAYYDHIKPILESVGLVSMSKRSGSYIAEPGATKKVSTFLNRILALPLAEQELVFPYFADTMEALISVAKSRGEFDQGILSLNAHSVVLKKKEGIHTDPASGAQTYHTVLDVNRGIPWEGVLKYRNDFVAQMRAEGKPVSSKNAFYSDNKNHGKTGHPHVLLATEVRRMFRGESNQLYRVQRPNITAVPHMKYGEMVNTYKKITDAEAKKHWQFWYDFSGKGCMHGKDCLKVKRGEACNWGQRNQIMHLINGAVLPLLKPLYQIVANSPWHKVEKDRNGQDKRRHPKVFRTKLDNGEIILGMELHPKDCESFIEQLKSSDFEANAPAGAPRAYYEDEYGGQEFPY